MRVVLALIAVLLFSASAFAVQPGEVLKDPALLQAREPAYLVELIVDAVRAETRLAK